MSKYCPNCRKEYESGKFCVECSSKLIDIVYRNYCPGCNKVVESGKFCVDCGTPLIARKFVGEDLLDDLIGIRVGFHNGPTDDEILAKYSDEFDDIRELNEEEAPVAVEEIKKIAEKGNPKAETFLAYLYFDGKYIEQDYQKSYDLICDAESKGYVMASAYKAMFYVQGIIVNQDLDEAERLIEPALDIPPAMYMKGMIYLSRDQEEEAVKWFKKAADNGDDNGLIYLGIAHLQGTGGVPLDPVKAFECFNKSAALGNAEAENMLGVCYQNGQGTEQDEEQALYWYQEAAKHNDPNAQNNLANCYKNGMLGLEVDLERAFEFYKKAAEQDNVDAMFEVAEYYDANYLTAQKSVEWYQKAADAGHGDAMFELAQKYENGWNVKQDSAKAQEYYSKAVEAGCERAIERENTLTEARLKEQAEARAKAEEEEKEREREAQRINQEATRKKEEEKRRIEEEARIKAEAEARKIAEEAQRKADEQIRAAKLEAEQKQKELDAQIAKQKAEQQQRIREEANRKKKRKRRSVFFFLILLGILGLGWYYFANMPFDSEFQDLSEEVTEDVTSGLAEKSAEEEIKDKTPERVDLPPQTRFIGSLKSNNGQTYPIIIVLDYYPSAEEGILANVSGYYYYQKYDETHNIKLSGTINSASGLSIHTDNGTEEFIGTIDGSFQEINGAWHQIKDGSVISTMSYSLSTTEQAMNDVEEEGLGDDPDEIFDPICIESTQPGSLKELLRDYSPGDVTDLIITGVLDARDFNTLKSTYTSLSYLDISDTRIAAFSGDGGTDTNTTVYREDELPLGAFFYWVPVDEGMPSLTEVILPKSIKAIGRNALARAYNIKMMDIPEGVQSIGFVAFAICTSLGNVDLPSTLTSIGNQAFSSDKNILRVNCKAITPPTLGNNVFDCPKATLHVPVGCKDDYANSNWGQYFSDIVADL